MSSIYGQSIFCGENSFVCVDESAKDFFDNINNWKTHNEKHTINKFISNSLSDEEYNKLKECLEIMKTTDSYDEYKKAFSRFCYFCNIAPRGVILRKYELKKGDKENNNSINVEYVNNTKKITLPEGIKLYHMSKVPDIKELIPVFRGKSEKGYLYDKPRIYFTIRKNMPKFLADYKPTQKMHMYLCKQDIKQAYVDPLVWNYSQGAVYIEINKPVPVKELSKEDTEEIIDDAKDGEMNNESFNFESFYEFVTENGLILEEE